MKVRPIADFKLLGTDIALDSTKVYEAVLATNQPNWEKRQCVFVKGVLLERQDYELMGDEQ